MPLPKALSAPAEFILNQDLRRVIQNDKSDLKKLKKLADEASRLSLQLDDAALRYEAGHKINNLMSRLKNSPEDTALLASIEATIGTLLTVVPELDLQTAQNVLFAISVQTYPHVRDKANSGEKVAKKWIESFQKLAEYLGVKLR